MAEFCTNCGAPLSGVFCGRCGHRAQSASAPAPVAAPTAQPVATPTPQPVAAPQPVATAQPVAPPRPAFSSQLPPSRLSHPSPFRNNQPSLPRDHRPRSRQNLPAQAKPCSSSAELCSSWFWARLARCSMASTGSSTKYLLLPAVLLVGDRLALKFHRATCASCFQPESCNR